jgi:hypothetical protein
MTKRQELERRMDEAAQKYTASKDPKFRRDLQGMALALTDFNHLTVLENALNRCRLEDMRTREVRTALEYFSARLPVVWPVELFRNALNTQHEKARWQVMNTSLNAIRMNVSSQVK